MERAATQFHPGAKPGPVVPPAIYEFHNEPFHFYNHPAVSAYKLNKLLYDSRFKPQLRLRMLLDAESVGAEYGLKRSDIEVLKKVCKLENNRTDRLGRDADPLVDIGAHPIGALMAIHVLQADQRRMMKAAEVLV